MKNLNKKFGIHGRDEDRVKNLGQEGAFSGHYFFIGNEEYKLSPKVFDSKLYNSIGLALRHSHPKYSFDVSQGQLDFQQKPALVLLEGDFLDAHNGSRNYFGSLVEKKESFNIGESLCPFGEFLDYTPILLSSENEARVKKSFEDWCNKNNVHPLEKDLTYWTMGAAYFLQDRLVQEFFNEVKGEMFGN